MPAGGEVLDEVGVHYLSEEKHSARVLVEVELEGWRPEGRASEEGDDPLSLQCRYLHHGREEAHPTLKVRTATNRHGRGEGSVHIPDRVPAKAGDLEEQLTRWRGEAALVPKSAEELQVGKQAAALEGDVTGGTVLGDAFKVSIESGPVFLNTIRGQDKIITKYPEGNSRSMDVQS